MRETVMGTIQKGGHEWEIKRRMTVTGNNRYVVYQDGVFWCTADSYRDAEDEIEEATKEEKG